MWWLVGKIEDARAERLRVDELQRLPTVPVLEETLPATEDHRMNHKPEFVDEVASKQRTHKSAAAEYRDVLPRLPFEPRDLLSDIALDQRGVIPLKGLFQGR